MYAPMIGAKSVTNCLGIFSRAVMIAPPPQRAVCDGVFSPAYAAMLFTVCCINRLGSCGWRQDKADHRQSVLAEAHARTHARAGCTTMRRKERVASGGNLDDLLREVHVRCHRRHHCLDCDLRSVRARLAPSASVGHRACLHVSCCIGHAACCMTCTMHAVSGPVCEGLSVTR